VRQKLVCFEWLRIIYGLSVQSVRLQNAIEEAVLCAMWLTVDVVRQMYVDDIWNFLNILSYIQGWTWRSGSGSIMLLWSDVSSHVRMLNVSLSDKPILPGKLSRGVNIEKPNIPLNLFSKRKKKSVIWSKVRHMGPVWDLGSKSGILDL
jgi:hypothetical protein